MLRGRSALPAQKFSHSATLLVVLQLKLSPKGRTRWGQSHTYGLVCCSVQSQDSLKLHFTYLPRASLLIRVPRRCHSRDVRGTSSSRVLVTKLFNQHRLVPHACPKSFLYSLSVREEAFAWEERIGEEMEGRTGGMSNFNLSFSRS